MTDTDPSPIIDAELTPDTVVQIHPEALALQAQSYRTAHLDLAPIHRSVTLAKLEQASLMLKECRDAHEAASHVDSATRLIHAAKAVKLQIDDLKLLGKYLARSSARLGQLISEQAMPMSDAGRKGSLARHGTSQKLPPTNKPGKTVAIEAAGVSMRQAKTLQELGRLDEDEIDARADALIEQGRIPTPRSIVDAAKRDEFKPAPRARQMTRDEYERCHALLEGGGEGAECAEVIASEEAMLDLRDRLRRGGLVAAIAIVDAQPCDAEWVAHLCSNSDVLVLSPGRTVAYRGDRTEAFAMLWESAGIVVTVRR